MNCKKESVSSQRTSSRNLSLRLNGRRTCADSGLNRNCSREKIGVDFNYGTADGSRQVVVQVEAE